MSSAQANDTTWTYPGEAMSAADFEDLRAYDSADELSRGWLVREPGPGARHGMVAARLFALLEKSAPDPRQGLLVFNSGFVLRDEPATVRVPDVAWIARERIPAEVPASFWRLAPDLAVEVVSPGNRTSDMQQRVLDYLESGTRLFWVIDPESRSVMVYRSRTDIRLLTPGDELSGEDLLPAFRVAVGALL